MINPIAIQRKELIPAFLLLLLLLSMLLQDLDLQNHLGTIAKSPMVFVSPLIFLSIVLHQNKIQNTPLIKYYFTYAVVSILCAVLMLLITVFFVTKGNFTIYTEFIPVKLVKASFYNITYFLTVYNLYVLLKQLSLKTISNLLDFSLCILLLYGYLQLFFNFRITLINSTVSDTSRISLTTSEPSNAAVLLTTFAITSLGIRLYINKSKVISCLLISLSLFILIYIGSKGVLILIPVALIIAIRKSLNLKVVIVSLLVILLVGTVIIQRVIPLLAKDINEFNSFSTRATTFVAAFASLFKYPIGEGYGTYLIYFPPMLLPTNAQIISVTGFPLLNEELTEMVETGVNLPAKSGIANEIVYNGFIAVIFLVYICRYYARNLKIIYNKTVKLIFSFLGILLVIIFMFNSIIETAYFYLLPLVILPKFANNSTL